ncbi:UNVERIFIED_CONTAM: putative ribonuclease H protein [Sesamum calycinum]|uniref:Ribonuclease H protein n=1 Tax=Sesamum calycinum TaxID=2727403 RepID=A0AAW2JIT9_9LAMI
MSCVFKPFAQWSWFTDYDMPATVVYGANDSVSRRGLWQSLVTLADSISDEPWIVGGDFNTVVGYEENSFLGIIAVKEIVAYGNVDRLLVNDAWLRLWPNSHYQCLNARTSDHSPLVLRGDTDNHTVSMFRFDNYLTMSSEFIPLVQNVWRHRIEGTSMYAVTRKLRALKPVFRTLRKKKGDLSVNVKLAADFWPVQQLLQIDRHNTLLLCLEKCCKLVFFKATKLEQVMLQQRAKIQWLKGGDQCSRIFFRKVAMRRASKRVFQIINEDGHTLTTQEDVVNEFVSFYQRLLGGDRRREFIDLRYLRPWARHVLTQEESQALVQSVTREEIKDAFFDIAEDKAPGPDGYSSGFYKAAWPVIGEEMIKAILEFFTGRLLKQVNTTILALIPKVRAPSTVSDFRPISCCNVLYKVITKIIVQRLRLVLDKLISPSQNAFVPGRSIGDNILLAQELFAGYNRQGLPMRCALKVDLRKAHGMDNQWEPSRFLQGFRGMRDSPSIGGARSLDFFQLCFADDLLLFCKADVASVRVFRHGLAEFAKLSGYMPIHKRVSLFSPVQHRMSGNNYLQHYISRRVTFPSGVIREVEKKMRTFLWKGNSAVGYPKVAWSVVCKPIEEGGQGIRDILALNKALMSRHLWNVIQNNQSSIWVKWIAHTRLRHKSVWTVDVKGGSWGWRKILRLRSALLPYIEFKIGDGESFSLWHDPWHSLGSLITRFPRGPGRTNIPEAAKLSAVLVDGDWSWPPITDLECIEILHVLPIIHNGSDSILWRGGGFSTKAVYDIFRNHGPKCIRILKGTVRFTWPNRAWAVDIAWASKRWNGRHIVQAAYRALLAAIVYHIWQERNRRVFQQSMRPSSTIARIVVDEMRQKIISIDLPDSVSSRGLYRLWRIPWPVRGTA